MATMAQTASVADDARFFLKLAIAIAVTIVVAFAQHFALGRSSIDVPLVYHLHGVVYMGWVAIFVAQHWLAARGHIAGHRRLGRIAMLWIALMVVMGIAITVTVVQRGTTPFFFRPQHFLIANPLTLLAFVGLVVAAVRMRARTDWHRRLHLCAMAMILGPAFGRLLPSPFLIPWAFEVATLAGLIFPLIALVREWRAGAVHPAWKWGLPVLPIVLLFAHVAAPTAAAGALYQAVTDGTPGAAIAPLEFGAPPQGMM
jgi:hypothetical protein